MFKVIEKDKYPIAEYMCCLNYEMFLRYCNIAEINPDEINPYVFTDEESIYNCLKTFLDNGVPLNILFDNDEIWGNYLKFITEKRYHKAIDLILCSGSKANLILYFRACYRYGFPALDDGSFDVLEKFYIMTYPDLKFLNDMTYDDDIYNPIILEALKMSGVRNKGAKADKVISSVNNVSNQEYVDLNSEKSKSIRPITSAEEAFEFWKSAPDCDVHFSLKVDGINTKMVFDEDGSGLKLALSRGRATDSIDYTKAINNMILAKGIDAKELHGRITGESFVSPEDLKIMNSRYPTKDYKTPKSTAMAMLRSPDNFLPEDYKYLSLLAFDYNDESPDKAFLDLNKSGMATPPSLFFNGKDIPKSSLQEFNEWMDLNVLNPMWSCSKTMGIGSDGVVMYLVGDVEDTRVDKYSDCNIAIKYSYWSAATYTSKVVDFVFEQKRVEASIVLIIEPVTMRDRNVATRVGIGSPNILISDDVRIGSIIEFERKSEAYNVYLRKIQ